MSGVSLSCSTLRCLLFCLLLIPTTDGFFPLRGALLKTVSRLSDITSLLLLNLSLQPYLHDTSHALSCLQKPHILLKMQYSKIKSGSSREMANSECVPMVLSDYIHRRTGTATGSTVGHWSTLVHSVGMIHRSQVPSQKASCASMQVERWCYQQGFQRHHSLTGRFICSLHSDPTLPSTANTSQLHHVTETRSSSRSFTADLEELIKRSQTPAILLCCLSKRTVVQYLVSNMGWLLALPCSQGSAIRFLHSHSRAQVHLFLSALQLIFDSVFQAKRHDLKDT